MTAQDGITTHVSDNYEWYVKTDTSKYAGKWIAIMNGKIVASGEDADKVYREAEKECPDGKFSIAKVPCDEILVLVIRP